METGNGPDSFIESASGVFLSRLLGNYQSHFRIYVAVLLAITIQGCAPYEGDLGDGGDSTSQADSLADDNNTGDNLATDGDTAAMELAESEKEQERIAAELAEQERLARELAARLQLEQNEAERVKLEMELAEKERLARELAEQLAKEKEIAERLAKEKEEAERLARENAADGKLAMELVGPINFTQFTQIIQRNCVHCHGGAGSLYPSLSNFKNYNTSQKWIDSGVIVPGNRGRSPVYFRLTYAKGKVSSPLTNMPFPADGYPVKMIDAEGEAIGKYIDSLAVPTPVVVDNQPAPMPRPGVDPAAVERPAAGGLKNLACKPESYGSNRTAARRLTISEAVAAVKGLLGNSSAYTSAYRALADVQEIHVLENVAEYDDDYNNSQVKDWLQEVSKLSRMITTTGAAATVAGDSCVVGSLSGEAKKACWEKALGQMIFRAWRRPATSDEVSYILTNIVGAKTGYGPLQDSVFYLLISPNFMFHIEKGKSISGDRVRLTDYEILNRIFFNTVGFLPVTSNVSSDSATWNIYQQALASAQKGELQNLNVVKQYVKSLLQTKSGKDRLEFFYANWLQYSNVQFYYRIFESVPGAERNEQNVEQFQSEMTHFMNYVIWDMNGDFNDLFTLKKAFPMPTKGNHAKLVYKTSGSAAQSRDNLQPYDAPNHPGIIYRVGNIASPGINNEPIQRGVKLLRRFLCVNLPSPSTEIFLLRDEESQTLDPLKAAGHEIVTGITKPAACMTCHSIINPAAFAFEQYNTWGMKVTQQEVLKRDKVEKVFPLPQGPFTFQVSNDLRLSVANSDELSQAVAESFEAKQCMSDFFFQTVNKRFPEKGDLCEVKAMADELAAGRSILDALVINIANEGIFWRKLK